MQCPLKKATVSDLRRLAFLFVCLFFYGNFKIQEKVHPSLFIYLVTTAVQFSFILCGWLRMFILLFPFVCTSKFVSHDQCHNKFVISWSKLCSSCLVLICLSVVPCTSSQITHVWLACDSRFALASAPEEEEANVAVSCCTRLFLAKCFMIPERILVQTPALMVF